MRGLRFSLLLAAIAAATAAPAAEADIVGRKVVSSGGTVYRFTVAVSPAKQGRIHPYVSAHRLVRATKRWVQIGDPQGIAYPVVTPADARRNVFNKGSRFLKFTSVVRAGGDLSFKLKWRLTRRDGSHPKNWTSGWWAASRTTFNPAG